MIRNLIRKITEDPMFPVALAVVVTLVIIVVGLLYSDNASNSTSSASSSSKPIVCQSITGKPIYCNCMDAGKIIYCQVIGQ